MLVDCRHGFVNEGIGCDRPVRGRSLSTPFGYLSGR